MTYKMSVHSIGVKHRTQHVHMTACITESPQQIMSKPIREQNIYVLNTLSDPTQPQ